jgi:PAS domain S-box-containing protein
LKFSASGLPPPSEREARDAAWAGLRALLWPAAAPVLLESAEGRLLDLNSAAATLFSGHGSPLVGLETESLLPATQRVGSNAARLARNRAAAEGRSADPWRLRCTDAAGQPRWLACVPLNVGGRSAADGSDPPRWLLMLQDLTAEVQAVKERERAEAERDHARQLVATLLDSGSVVVASYDPVQGWLMPTGGVAAGAATGGGAASAPGGFLTAVRSEFVRPGMRPEYERLQRALRHSEPAVVRFALAHPELGERWLQVHVAPRIDGGERRGSTVAMFDVTEREQAREALALQADRTRAVLNSVLVGIVTVGEQGMVWLNRSARRMFGGQLADFVGQPLSLVATPEPDHPLRRADWLHRLPEGQGESFECRLQALDGRCFWVAGSAVLTHDGGAPGSGERRVTLALLDIERRRQTETRVAAARGRLQRLIETAPLAIALFEPAEFRVRQANAAAAEFFARLPLPGLTPEECCDGPQALALRGWLERARDGESPVVQWPAEGAAADARVWDCRLARLSPDGADGDAAEAGEGGEGGEAVLLLVASDVTAQRSAEQARLAAAIAQREALVREVHHRIKNNLQGVAGLLQHNARQHPEVSTLLLEATSQVQAIAQVYGLQLGRPGPLRLADLLRAVAGGVERSLDRAVPTAGLAADDPAHAALLAEPEAIPLALVVSELLVNALKHGQPGSTRLRLEPASGRGVAVCIVSDGALPPGFDWAQVRGGVSGLGLVRALVPRRGATLSLEQRGPQVCAELRLEPPRIAWPEPG